jgi:hypothetical protein
VLHELSDRLDAGSPQQLTELGELGLRVGGGSQHRRDEAALRLGPGRGIRLVLCHGRIMPRS